MWEFAWRAPQVYPFHAGNALQWNEGTQDRAAPLEPEQLIPVHSQGFGNATTGATAVKLTAISLNVQGMRHKHKYIEAQLVERQCNVAFIQETKHNSGVCLSQHFLRLSTDCDVHFGVSIWVSRTLGIFLDEARDQACHVSEADVRVHFESPRLLILSIEVGGVKLGRPATLADGITGDLAYGDADVTGKHSIQCFESLKLWVPSTYSRYHQGESATYTHPTGARHRIDFLLLGGRAVLSAVRSVVLDSFDMAGMRDDHFPVLTQFQASLPAHGSRASIWRPKYDVRKMLTPAGRQIIEAAMANYSHPPWEVHPDHHCAHLTEYLQSIMEQHFAKQPGAPRASFITPAIWQLRDAKMTLKAKVRHRAHFWRDMLERAFDQWRSDTNFYVHSLVARHDVLYQLASAAIKFATHRIKNKMKVARNEHLQQLAGSGHDPAMDILAKVKRAGVGNRNRTPFRPLPILLKPDGSTARTRHERDQLWLHHFSAQEAGTILSVHDFLNAQPEPLHIDTELEWKIEHLPSVAEVESVMRLAPVSKAPGLDNIPGELLRSAPGPIAAAVHPLMVKAMTQLCQPVTWRGGLLYEAWKRAGSQKDPSAYRSLFVSSVLGKSYHKLLRRKVQGHLEHNLHPLHLGASKQAPVNFAAAYVLAFHRRGVRHNLSMATLFLDISAAYYRIVREVALGDILGDRQVINLFRRFSLDAEEMEDLMKEIRCGGMMADAQIPAPIRHAAKDLHHRAWFTTPYGTGQTLCRTAAGSRPGESWADAVFSFIYSRVLARISEAARGEGLLDNLEHEPSEGPFAMQGGSDTIEGADATWADDSSWPVTDDDPSRLLTRISRLASLVISHCQGHGMAPNLKPNKTAVLFVLRGRGAAHARKTFFSHARPTLQLHDLQLEVPVTNQYRHVGGLLDSRTKQTAEARRRLAMAGDAFEKGKMLLYINNNIPLPTRAALFSIAITSTFHNLCLWVPGDHAWEVMSSGYTRLLRRLPTKQFPGDKLFHLPPPLVHVLTDAPPLEHLARKTRLSFLCSLVIAGPPVLWASLQAEQSWFECIRQDLTWLAEGDKTSWPAAQAASWPEWYQLLRTSTSWFKRQVTRRHRLELDKFRVQQCTALTLWALYRKAAHFLPMLAGEQTAWACHPCQKTFRSKGALGAHFFKTHRRKAKYRAFVQGTVCLACGTQYWSTNRLSRHLRDTPQCVSRLQEHGHFATNPALGQAASYGDKLLLRSSTPRHPGRAKAVWSTAAPTSGMTHRS